MSEKLISVFFIHSVLLFGPVNIVELVEQQLAQLQRTGKACRK